MKALSWSHSALKDYENCARKYHEVRVLKNFKMAQGEKQLYGKRLHAAAEVYAKTGEMPEEFIGTDLRGIVDVLLTKKGVVSTELQLALTPELEPCDWFGKNVWVRGIVDLLIRDDEGKTAWIVDYKTGSDKYPDRDQLELMALLVFAHYPEILQANAALIYVLRNSMVKEKCVRWESDDAWQRYRERVARIEAAHESDVWNPHRSGLCGWCEVTTCEYNPNGD